MSPEFDADYERAYEAEMHRRRSLDESYPITIREAHNVAITEARRLQAERLERQRKARVAA